MLQHRETKKWELLDCTKLHEISWAEHAFDSLVVGQDEKDLLLALVNRNHLTEAKPFNGFVDVKGQCMIMLLCGPPGVGKTLVAESVAKHLRRPFYKLGVGDLSTDAQKVEANLGNALRLCSHYGALLHIDGADVFMEARSSYKLQRNDLVSAFLRLLEYYSGVMILNTYRMNSIFTATDSRVDITLSCKALTEAHRANMWKSFLGMFAVDAVDVSEADFIKLAKWDYNGHQIKRAIKTARILAIKNHQPLNAGRLNVVLSSRKKVLGVMNGEEKVVMAL